MRHRRCLGAQKPVLEIPYELSKLSQVYSAIWLVVVPLEHCTRAWCAQIDTVVSQRAVQLPVVDETTVICVKEIERLDHAHRHTHWTVRLARERLPCATLRITHGKRSACNARPTAAAQQHNA